ncbi:hypothetical protein EDD17DRAFT_1503187 [Pisolithus thermaeus]|nr:hypothetical protein EDD17DRAFT_1503187 [Pisolithus thermaeus]
MPLRLVKLNVELSFLCLRCLLLFGSRFQGPRYLLVRRVNSRGVTVVPQLRRLPERRESSLSSRKGCGMWLSRYSEVPVIEILRKAQDARTYYIDESTGKRLLIQPAHRRTRNRQQQPVTHPHRVLVNTLLGRLIAPVILPSLKALQGVDAFSDISGSDSIRISELAFDGTTADAILVIGYDQRPRRSVATFQECAPTIFFSQALP